MNLESDSKDPVNTIIIPKKKSLKDNNGDPDEFITAKRRSRMIPGKV